MGGPPAPSILANVACFRGAAEAAGLVIVDQVDNTRDSAANGATLAADMLIRHPGVQAFWAYNDQSALGISSAVFASGKAVRAGDKTDGIMVFGINGDDDAIQAVRDNRLTGTWDADYYATGFAMALAMKLAIENPGVAQTPLTVRSVLYTADNIGDWRPASERGYSLDNLPLVR
jgi:ribose transport system substrate-binding protein